MKAPRFFLPLVAALVAGCTLDGAVTVRVVLPDLPPAWKATVGEGVRAVVLPAGRDPPPAEATAAPWTAGADVTFPAAPNTALLAWPVPRGGMPGDLRPAGALWPLSARDGPADTELEFRWEDGPAALLLGRVAAAGRDTSLFNAERLALLLRARPDPWDVDLDGAAQAVAEGRFAMHDIDTLPSRAVSVPCGSGRWITESPFRPAVQADPGGRAAFDALTVGRHLLFSDTGRVVAVQVTTREVIASPLR